MEIIKVRRIERTNNEFTKGNMYDARIEGDTFRVVCNSGRSSSYFTNKNEPMYYGKFFEIIDNEDMKFRELLLK